MESFSPSPQFLISSVKHWEISSCLSASSLEVGLGWETGEAITAGAPGVFAMVGTELVVGEVVPFAAFWIGVILFVDIESAVRLEVTEFCWALSSGLVFKSAAPFLLK